MSLLLEFFCKFLVVINLAVKYNHHFACLVVHRLIAAVQIDDAQSPKAQCHVFIDITSAAVRTSVINTFHHIFDYRLLFVVFSCYSTNSTHNLHLLSCTLIFP